MNAGKGKVVMLGVGYVHAVRLTSMLRGINVGGRRRVPKVELVALYGELGFENVQSYLQSGNVVFDCDGDPPDSTARGIERAIRSRFSHERVDVIVHRPEEITSILSENPYLDAGADETSLYVTPLMAVPEHEGAATGSHAGDSFAVAGDLVYIACPGGYGRTRLTNDYFEKLLGESRMPRETRTMRSLFAASVVTRMRFFDMTLRSSLCDRL